MIWLKVNVPLYYVQVIKLAFIKFGWRNKSCCLFPGSDPALFAKFKDILSGLYTLSDIGNLNCDGFIFIKEPFAKHSVLSDTFIYLFRQQLVQNTRINCSIE